MNNENKIIVTSWNGKSWEMTPEQIEAATVIKSVSIVLMTLFISSNLMQTGLKKNMAIHTMKLSIFRKS